MSLMKLKNRVYSGLSVADNGNFETILNFDLEPVGNETAVDGVLMSSANSKIVFHRTSGSPSCVAHFSFSNFSSETNYIFLILHVYVSNHVFDSLTNFNSKTHYASFSFGVYDLLKASDYDFKSRGEPKATYAVPVNGFRVLVQEIEAAQSTAIPLARKGYIAPWLIVILLFLIYIKL